MRSHLVEEAAAAVEDDDRYCSEVSQPHSLKHTDLYWFYSRAPRSTLARLRGGRARVSRLLRLRPPRRRLRRRRSPKEPSPHLRPHIIIKGRSARSDPLRWIPLPCHREKVFFEKKPLKTRRWISIVFSLGSSITMTESRLPQKKTFSSSSGSSTVDPAESSSGGGGGGRTSSNKEGSLYMT